MRVLTEKLDTPMVLTLPNEDWDVVVRDKLYIITCVEQFFHLLPSVNESWVFVRTQSSALAG